MTEPRPLGRDTESLALTLPLPPSVNNQYLTVGRRRVLSKEAQAFHRDVKKRVELARRDGKISAELEAQFGEELLGIYLTFYFATPLKRDLDGGLKIALDALGKALGFDDRFVVDLHLTKQIDPLHPRLDVEIECIKDWAFDQSYVYLGPAEGAGTGKDGQSKMSLTATTRDRRAPGRHPHGEQGEQ